MLGDALAFERSGGATTSTSTTTTTTTAEKGFGWSGGAPVGADVLSTPEDAEKDGRRSLLSAAEETKKQKQFIVDVKAALDEAVQGFGLSATAGLSASQSVRIITNTIVQWEKPLGLSTGGVVGIILASIFTICGLSVIAIRLAIKNQRLRCSLCAGSRFF
jgi:hypothetical protein